MIKTIIIDLGGVLLNINHELTLRAFKLRGVNNIEDFYTQHSLFDLYETGYIDSKMFRKKIKEILKIESLNDRDFDEAWSAMLLNFSKENIKLIKKLRQKYRVILLSNTNEIHLRELAYILNRDLGECELSDYFDAAYYSCRTGIRKPEAAAFEQILLEHDLNPAETLFIDDTEGHVLIANSLGICGIHLTKEKTLFDILGNF